MREKTAVVLFHENYILCRLKAVSVYMLEPMTIIINISRLVPENVTRLLLLEFWVNSAVRSC